MNVLVTDDRYWVTLGIVRSLGRKGIRVSVMADSPMALASHSRYCSGRHLVPPYHEPSFIPAFLDLVRRVRFDLVIPVTYEATVTLAKHKEELQRTIGLEVAHVSKIQTASDKRLANELAIAFGVPAPRTACPQSYAEVENLSAEVEYPAVIKAAGETAYKRGVAYARNRSELLHIYRVVCERQNGTTGRLPLIQEYIPGFGCGFFALYQNGVCKRVFMHRRVREVPPKGGISCCAESYYDPKLKEYGTRLLDRLGWHGVAMAEFRYDTRDKDYKLIEINPKFWGSLDLALAAGVDFPFCLCQMARGEEIKYSEEYNRNLRFHWPLHEVQHLLKRPTSLGTVLRDFFDPRVKSNFWLHDALPHLLEPFSRARAAAYRFLRQQKRRNILGAEIHESQ